MLKPTYEIPSLPPQGELETTVVLKFAAIAHRYLAELKGTAKTIPNQGMLIDTLSLQEAKSSSEIENIITTQDELFQATLFPERLMPAGAKEVALYRDALLCGFRSLQERNGIISNNTIISMFQILKRHDGGFRNTPGTKLEHEQTGEVIYVPPQDADQIVRYMNELESFINEDKGQHLDILVRMAIIHHQFESIHPFPDGNGRLGRIINVLYLTQKGLLEIPILYLSRYITKNKHDYYRLLQDVRENNNWEGWIIYILRAVAETSARTIDLILAIRDLMDQYKQEIRSNYGKIYSRDLLNNLFHYPYTRIEYVANDLKISRQTASKYLEKLTEGGMLIKHQAGRNVYFINAPLLKLLQENEQEPTNEEI